MNKFLKLFVSVLFSVLVITLLLPTSFAYADDNSASTTYAIKYSKPMMDATIEYLNEMYVDKYPALGLRVKYGNECDREVLKTMSGIIVKDLDTNEKKANAIARWVKNNISYESYMAGNISYYPIDVFYDRKGNCLGASLLMTEFLRLEGIPAVVVGGTVGNMESVLTVESREIDHAWVMAYYDNKWHFFDPLFNRYDVTDTDYLAKWYFVDCVEGVIPYSAEVDYKYVLGGFGSMYKNGRTYVTVDGEIPATHYESMFSINGTIAYMAKTRYFDDNCITDGFHYLDDSENEEKRNALKFGQNYNDGWIIYGDSEPSGSLYYAQENGILWANGVVNRGDKTYLLTYAGDALVIPENKKNTSLKNGFMTYKVGETGKLPIPNWAQTYLDGAGDENHYLAFENYTEDLATVDDKGNVTGLKEGHAILGVLEMHKEDEGVHSQFSYIEIEIIKKDRIPDYSSVEIECEHEWDEGLVTKNATFKKTGIKTYTCKNCGEQKEKKLPKLVKQTISVSKKASKTVTYKASNLKKKKASFDIGAKAKTKLSYKVTKGSSKNISVSKKGKVTLKKGCTKGTYYITVTATESAKYGKATKKIKVVVK